MNPESTSSLIIYHNLDLTAVLISPRAVSCFASSRSSRLRIFPAALYILQLIIEQYTPEDAHLLGITSMTATPFEPLVEKKKHLHIGEVLTSSQQFVLGNPGFYPLGHALRESGLPGG